MFAHTVLKETSARGCDIVALRRRVHLGTKGVGKIYLWLFDTQSELPRPMFLISLSHVIGR